MSDTPRDYEEALLYLRQQAHHLSPPPQYGLTWHNDCQALAHVEYGIMEGGNGSAYAQWLNTSPANRHPGGDPADAPLGALLCSKGSGPFGHIWTAARQFRRTDTDGGWGPDMNPNEFGGVSKFRRDAPMTVWGHTYLGYITEINGWELDLSHTKKKPKPLQNKRYLRLQNIIEMYDRSIETAKKDRDKADVAALRKQQRAAKALYSKIKHS